MNYRGFLLFEILLAVAVFLVSLTGTLFAYRSSELVITNAISYSQASRYAQNDLERAYLLLKKDFYKRDIPSLYDNEFKGSVKVMYENDASLLITSTISYDSYGKSHQISYRRRITIPEKGRGLSTCSDTFKESDISHLDIRTPSSLSLGAGNIPTDIDVVGSYVFISSDSAKLADPDMFIFKIQASSSLVLLSSLNTGPGISSIQVVGNIVYGANQSINGQLQVIDTTDLMHPILKKTIKIPGDYKDSTMVGKKILYDTDTLYLGTEKNSVEEFHIFDVHDPYNPLWKSSFETNAGINALASRSDISGSKVYVALPTDPELKVLNTTNVSSPQLLQSYDAPTGSGNGKSVSLQDDVAVLGRTLGNKELILLDTSSQSTLNPLASLTIGASIDDLIIRKPYIFLMTSNLADAFQTIDFSTSMLIRANSKKFKVSSRPVSLDCDKHVFYMLLSDPINPLAIISA